MTDLASIMEATDTLVITSASGIADSVKFVGTVVLGANNNISITNITIDASAGNYGVQLTKPCDNIEISNCIIWWTRMGISRCRYSARCMLAD